MWESIPSQLFILPLCGITCTWIAGKVWRQHAVSRHTILNDLPALGTPRSDGARLGDTVVIIGGSIAGLLSAQVCSDHFRRVIIVDPEMSSLIAGSREPSDAKFPPAHSRIMQYKSVHSAQAIFTAVMDRLFGFAFRNAAKAADAVIGPAHYHIHLGGILVKAPLESLPEAARTCVGMSRAAHETVLRSLVARNAENRGIEFVDGNVIGFDVDPQDPKRLKSVKYRDNHKGQSIVTVEAEFVIDCSGSSRVGLSFLQRITPPIDLPKTITESYHPHMRYSSCTYTNARAALKPWRELAGPDYAFDSPIPSLFVPVPGLETRQIGMILVEGDQLKFLAGGPAFEGKVESASELRDFARSLRCVRPLPGWFFEILDFLVEQELDSPGQYEHATIAPMTFVKYHEHTHVLPRNFVALGDSWMRLNPINGQGMAKVALEVTTLDGVLRKLQCVSTGLDIATTFFDHLAARTAGAWDQQKLTDYALPTCEPAQGETRDVVTIGAKAAIMNAFGTGIRNRMMRGDLDVASKVLGVAGWVRPSTDLFMPSVLMKIVFDKFFRW